MSAVGEPIYLALPAAVVDTALREWLDADGCIVDPFETSDRWQGGTAARFACPAAILARQGGRDDLAEPVCRVPDQLCGNIADAMAEGRPAFLPGVTDLVCKGIMAAREQADPFASGAQRARWDEALASRRPEIAYTMQGQLESGSRFTNCEAYASVGEWRRCDAIKVAGDGVKWRLTHDLDGLAAKQAVQIFALTPGRLEMAAEVKADAEATDTRVGAGLRLSRSPGSVARTRTRSLCSRRATIR